MIDNTNPEVEVMTHEDYYMSRDKHCKELGYSWEEIKAMARDCGCCLDWPGKPNQRDYAERVWRTFKNGWRD